MTRWRARAFGLELEGDFEAPGLPPERGPTPPGARHVHLEVVTPAELEATWDPTTARTIYAERLGGTQAERTISAHPRLGYRLYARHFGLAIVAADGRRVRCAPPTVAAWRWQRFLVGRVLPFVAVLRGLEALHAGAVTVRGHAVALVGGTGAGKTSLTLALARRGCPWLTDDVLALEATADGVRAHAGAAVAALRHEESARLGATRRATGQTLGRSDRVYLAVTRDDAPRPLGPLYFLDRGAGGAGIEPLGSAAARLLAATFVPDLDLPARRLGQLDVAARATRVAPALRLPVRTGQDPDALAGEVLRHATSLLAREVAA